MCYYKRVARRYIDIATLQPNGFGHPLVGAFAPTKIFMVFRLDAGTIAVSQKTPDGWGRVYLRIAKAGHPYRYQNLDGSERVEFCDSNELFRKDSVDTLKMVPIGIGHPASRRVNAQNVGAYLKGSTGHTVVREKTPDGEFLGITATVFAQDALDAMQHTDGISPGYGTNLSDRNDGCFSQHQRRYNHVAAGVIPRGGPEVRAMFAGMRVDSVDDSDLWIAQFNEDAYRSPVDMELILPILERGDGLPEMAEKTPVNLDRYKLSDSTKAEEETCPKCDEKKVDCECSSKKGKRSKPQGFGNLPKKKKKMETTSFQLDGITYEEVPILFAQALAPIVSRADSVEDLQSQLAEVIGRNDSLTEELERSWSRADELDTELTETQSLLAVAAENNDSEGESETRLDEDEIFAVAVDVAATVDQMRADGEVLQGLGVVKSFNTDFAYIAQNMGALQREMVAAVSPRMADRVDSMDDDSVAVAYEVALDSARQQAASLNTDSVEGEEDRNDMGMGHYGGKRYPMLNAGKPTLAKVGRASRPMVHSQQSVQSLLNKYQKEEDKAFDEASSLFQSSLRHPLAAKLM